MLLLHGTDISTLNKTKTKVGRIGQSQMAKFITEYKADANISK
jgi:hypothetical protein